MSWLLICLSVAQSACANIRMDRQPIAQVWVTRKPLGVVRRCLVKALDDERRTYSKISPSVKHVAKVIEPNSIIEIRPAKEHALVDVNYHVRLEKIADAITRIALYSPDSGAKQDSPDSGQKKKPLISTGRDVAQAVSRCSPSQ